MKTMLKKEEEENEDKKKKKKKKKKKREEEGRGGGGEEEEEEEEVQKWLINAHSFLLREGVFHIHIGVICHINGIKPHMQYSVSNI